MLFTVIWLYIAYDEKLYSSFVVVLLFVTSFFFLLCTSKILSLSLVFSSLNLMYLSCGFLCIFPAWGFTDLLESVKCCIYPNWVIFSYNFFEHFYPITFFFFFLAALGLVAVHRLFLVAASGGYSSLRCMGFSLWWLLLLWSTGFRHTG